MVLSTPLTPYNPFTWVHLRAPGGCPISNKKQADLLAVCDVMRALLPAGAGAARRPCTPTPETRERLNRMPWSNQSGGGRRGGGGWPVGSGTLGRPAASARPRGAAQTQPGQAEAGDARRHRPAWLRAVPGRGGGGGRGRLLRLHVPRQSRRARRRHAFGKPIRRSRRACTSACPTRSRRCACPRSRARTSSRSACARASPAAASRRRARRPEESLMLTGDENIVDVDFVVFWRIRDAQAVPVQYPEPRGDRQRGGRERHARDRRPVQHPADPDGGAPEDRAGRAEADAGDARQLQGGHPHRPGAAAEGRPADPGDRRLPRCAGRPRRPGALCRTRRSPMPTAWCRKRAARPSASCRAPRAYKEQTVAEATGQTSRFLKVYDEYKKAPEVTRKRMYLETMERVLGGTDKIILDSKGGQGVVPYPAARSAAEEARKGPTDVASLVGSPCGGCRRDRRRRLFRAVHRARERAGDRARVRQAGAHHQ